MESGNGFVTKNYCRKLLTPDKELMNHARNSCSRNYRLPQKVNWTVAYMTNLQTMMEISKVINPPKKSQAAVKLITTNTPHDIASRCTSFLRWKEGPRRLTNCRPETKESCIIVARLGHHYSQLLHPGAAAAPDKYNAQHPPIVANLLYKGSFVPGDCLWDIARMETSCWGDSLPCCSPANKSRAAQKHT